MTEFVTKVGPDGKLPQGVAKAISAILAASAGKAVRIVISPYKKRRSTNQNAYYWAVVIPPILAMFREAGNNVDAEDVHEFLKENVGKLRQVFVTPDGEVLSGTGSTARLTTMEMEVYLEKVRAWAAEFDLAIPLPNETVLADEGHPACQRA